MPQQVVGDLVRLLQRTVRWARLRAVPRPVPSVPWLCTGDGQAIGFSLRCEARHLRLHVYRRHVFVGSVPNLRLNHQVLRALNRGLKKKILIFFGLVSFFPRFWGVWFTSNEFFSDEVLYFPLTGIFLL